MSDGGKGSAPRPYSVGHDVFSKQFEAIFGKKERNASNEEIGRVVLGEQRPIPNQTESDSSGPSSTR